MAMFNRNMKMGHPLNSPLQKKVLSFYFWPKRSGELGGFLIFLFLKDHENRAIAQFSFTYYNKRCPYTQSDFTGF